MCNGRPLAQVESAAFVLWSRSIIDIIVDLPHSGAPEMFVEDLRGHHYRESLVEELGGHLHRKSPKLLSESCLGHALVVQILGFGVYCVHRRD
jgi:hypothetical protein